MHTRVIDNAHVLHVNNVHISLIVTLSLLSSLWCFAPAQASKYLADQTLNAISEMFSSAREIMNWLAECARLVASDGDQGSPVMWTSPLGLPIMQPYHKPQMTTLQTATQSFSVSIAGCKLCLDVSLSSQQLPANS